MTTQSNSQKEIRNSLYRRPPTQARDPAGVIGASSPELPHSGVMLAMEGDRWIVGLAGYLGDYPPTDDEGFRAFAASISPRIQWRHGR